MDAKRLMEIAKECNMDNIKIEELADTLDVVLDSDELYPRPFKDTPTKEEADKLSKSVKDSMNNLSSLPLICINDILKRFDQELMWKPEVRFMNDLVQIVKHFIYSQRDLYNFYDAELAKSIRAWGMNIGAIDDDD